MKIIIRLKETFRKRKKFSIGLIIFFVTALLITSISIMKKDVTVVVDGKQVKFSTFQNTVGGALKKQQITVNSADKISKNLNAKIEDKDVITVKRAVKLKVMVDGRELKVNSAEVNVGSMLKAEKITIRPEDKVSPGKDTKLSKDMKVTITRVETKVSTESAPVAFDTVVKKDSNMLSSQKKVLQEGQSGEKQITTSVVYENGKEVSRKVIKEVVTKPPVSRILAQGTLASLPLSRGTTSASSGKSIRVKATAYWAVNGVGTTYTASGRKAVRDPGGYSTIAVDPRVIPLGTKVYVEGYGYAIAADKGTAVNGNFIDVFFNTYQEACNWGLKYVNVYILQ